MILQTSKDDLKVIPIKNGLLRMGRPGVKPLEPGKMLYYIWHERTGLYYGICYTDQDYALKLAREIAGPRDMKDVAMAWVPEAKHCKHSYRTED